VGAVTDDGGTAEFELRPTYVASVETGAEHAASNRSMIRLFAF
jgi:hypothetical protein